MPVSVTPDIKIVIAVNKNDLWFCRICIASIRYYYPDVEILIIKDYLNGQFKTREIEQRFNVGVLDLGIRKYGWAASKMHVLLSEMPGGDKVFLMDSDIIFVGRFLEKLLKDSEGAQFSVSAHFTEYADSLWMRETYYDLSYFQSVNPRFNYPGYVFNTGQLLFTPGVLKLADVSTFFTLDLFPFWKKK